MAKILRFAGLAFGVLWLAISPAAAQQRPDDLLLQFQQRLQQGQDPSANDDETETDGSMAPDRQTSPQQFTAPQQPPSAIEQEYRKRLRAMALEDDSDAQAELRRSAPRQADMAIKAGRTSSQGLSQVGYDVLAPSQFATQAPKLAGGVSDSYILGIGDQVNVTLRGQVNTSKKVVVDRSGQIILPDLPPFEAAGRSFGEFRSELEAYVESSLVGTKAFATLGTVRQMSVLVSGEVEQPGMVTVTGLSSVIDALIAARGVRKTGSLRSVQVIRDGQVQTLDLYPLLLGLGKPGDISLREGDRIVVPPIGPTLAIFASVSRPGIYELKGNSVSLNEALQMAGGPLTAKGGRLLKISLGSDGRTSVTEYTQGKGGSLGRGDILGVLTPSQATQGAIYLSGHVYREGWRSLGTTPTLRGLLSNRSLFKDEPYLPLIVLKRSNPATLAPEFIAVDGARVLRAGEDMPLQDQDRVIILSVSDVRYLSSEDVKRVLYQKMPAYGRSEDFSRTLSRIDGENSLPNQTNTPAPQTAAHKPDSYQPTEQRSSNGIQENDLNSMRACAGLRRLSYLITQKGIPTNLRNTLLKGGDINREVLRDIQVCPELFDKEAELLPFLISNVMSLQGAVQNPGLYPVTEGGFLSDVIAAAGGVDQDADRNKVEATTLRNGSAVRQEITLALALADFTISPMASVRVNGRFSNADGGIVQIGGEVRYPGTYSLLRGERLSQLIERAGGYTEQAYVLGAVFSRESIRSQQQENYDRLAQEMEASIPSVLQKMANLSNDQQQGTAQALQQAVLTLRNAKASGRMVIDANPLALQNNPDADVLLHSGDMLYVPRRPGHIMLSGEVMYAGAQRFEPGMPAEEYIKKAGGLRDTADESRMFVILPDGSARPLHANYWNYEETQLPPGSTIVIPQDMTPLMFWSYARDTLSIFSDIAISAAALASIDR